MYAAENTQPHMPIKKQQKTSTPKSSFSLQGFLGDGAWVVANQVLSALAAIIGVRLLTELLPPQIYGQILLLLGLVGLGQLLSCSPLLQAVFRFYPEVSQDTGLTRLRGLAGRMLFYPTLGMMLVLLVGGLFYHKESYTSFVLLAIIFPVEIVQSFEQNLLSAARRQRAVAIWQIALAWGKPLLAIAMIWTYEPSTSSVLLGYLIASVAILLLLYVLPFSFEGKHTNQVKSPLGPVPRVQEFSQHLQKQMMAYAMPLIPLGIVGWVHALGDRYLLGGLVGLKQAGMYIAAYGLIQKPYMMSEGVFQQTLLPAYNQAISQANRKQERRIFRMWLFLLTATVTLGCFCVYFLREWVVRLCLAEAYWSTTRLMPWLALGFAFLSIAHVFEWRLYSLKRTRLVLLGQTIAAISSIAIAVPLIQTWTLMGAAIACPLYYAVYLIIMVILSQQAIQHHHNSFEDKTPCVS